MKKQFSVLENLLDARMKKAKQRKCEVSEELAQTLETLSGCYRK
jgi:hypothetical protein